MSKTRTTRQTILSLIKRRPVSGITRKQIQARTGFLIQTVTPRVNELLNEGTVRQSTTRVNGSSVLYPVNG